MRRFRSSVYGYGIKKVVQGSAGSFTPACLPLPPKIVVLPKENINLKLNKYDDLCLLNDMTKVFNVEENISSMPTMWAPRFYTWGLNRVSNRKTFAQFLRNERQHFSFFAHQFCANKPQFAQSFAKVISRKIALFRFCKTQVLRNLVKVKRLVTVCVS